MAFKICLDAGHDGKYNQSKVVPQYYESDFNWKLYTYLKKNLEEYGITVVGTRENQNVKMGTITRGTKSKGCDLFLSLHADSAERESADFVVIIEMLTKKQHKFAVAIAKVIQDIMNTKERYDIRTKAKDDGGEWYGVLQGCDQVGNQNGLIIEHSFWSNKTRATWMLNDDNVRKLAQAEADTIASYFGITKPSAPVVNEVKTYEVVTTINRYNSESEAKAKKNSIGTYAPGIYYIYNKYPNGSQGMLNISKDKTGNTAGSWINPAENVVVVATPAPAPIPEPEPETPPVETPVETPVVPEPAPVEIPEPTPEVVIPEQSAPSEPEIEVKDEVEVETPIETPIEEESVVPTEPTTPTTPTVDVEVETPSEGVLVKIIKWIVEFIISLFKK